MTNESFALNKRFFLLLLTSPNLLVSFWLIKKHVCSISIFECFVCHGKLLIEEVILVNCMFQNDKLSS